ncbi:MAG TPA: hypothetical protein VGB24_20355 [Longimicrobium sp.]|uniref:hypothetical protein n=1 Tax=Longimicrobium sp. TaxID=2029185 RepID=UPI002EDB2340
MSRPERMTRWFIFGVLISLIPLAVSYFSLKLDRRAPTLGGLLAGGELLLISTTVAAGCIGELIPVSRGKPVEKLIAGGACMLIVLFSTSCFAAVKSRASPDPSPIRATSLLLFASAVVAGAGCVYLANDQEVV